MKLQMKKRTSLLLGMLAAVSGLSARTPENVIWFDKPAQAWEEAWPEKCRTRGVALIDRLCAVCGLSE